jgi:hypothetical protein
LGPNLHKTARTSWLSSYRLTYTRHIWWSIWMLRHMGCPDSSPEPINQIRVDHARPKKYFAGHYRAKILRSTHNKPHSLRVVHTVLRRLKMPGVRITSTIICDAASWTLIGICDVTRQCRNDHVETAKVPRKDTTGATIGPELERRQVVCWRGSDLYCRASRPRRTAPSCDAGRAPRSLAP